MWPASSAANSTTGPVQQAGKCRRAGTPEATLTARSRASAPWPISGSSVVREPCERDRTELRVRYRPDVLPLESEADARAVADLVQPRLVVSLLPAKRYDRVEGEEVGDEGV